VKFRSGIGETICDCRDSALGGDVSPSTVLTGQFRSLSSRREVAVRTRDTISRGAIARLPRPDSITSRICVTRNSPVDTSRRRHSESISGMDDRQQVIFLRGGQHHLLADRAGRDHADDLRGISWASAVGRLPARKWRLCVPPSGACDVRFRGMVGHAAKRDAVIVTRGEAGYRDPRADLASSKNIS